LRADRTKIELITSSQQKISWDSWCTVVILAMWEKSWSEAGPGKKCTTLFEKKNLKQKGLRGVIQRCY
jgi:hypothetical protein